jgi:hypothetical protein
MGIKLTSNLLKDANYCSKAATDNSMSLCAYNPRRYFNVLLDTTTHSAPHINISLAPLQTSPSTLKNPFVYQSIKSEESRHVSGKNFEFIHCF